MFGSFRLGEAILKRSRDRVERRHGGALVALFPVVLTMAFHLPSSTCEARDDENGLDWLVTGASNMTAEYVASWRTGAFVPTVLVPALSHWASNESAEVTAAEARLLTRHTVGISFRRLRSLSPSAARELSRYPGALHFDALVELDPRSAAFLAGDRPLRFPALRRLSPDTALSLAGHRHMLNLGAVETLTDEAAEHLSRQRGFLSLNGLACLTVRAADALSRHEGPLCLNGLVDPSPGVIAVLARSRHGLSLNGLRTLDDAAAADLGGHAGRWLHLEGVERLSARAVEALGRHRGDVSVGLFLHPVAHSPRQARWHELRVEVADSRHGRGSMSH